jgi:PhnB protein
MAGVSTYLIFNGNAEEAFDFYKTVFGTEYEGGIMRYGDAPPPDGAPALSEEDQRKIVNVTLPILGGHVLMASDMLPAFSEPVTQGTNVQITLLPDTRPEADRLHAALAAGGEVRDAMAEAFWGDYYGAVTDRFGIQWNINTAAKA